MKKMLLIVIMILIYSGNAWGEKTEKINPTLENISGVYAECAAYFAIVYNAFLSSGDAGTAAQYAKSQESAVSTAMLLAKQGRTLKMAYEVTKSRIEMYSQQMKKDTKNRNENISILANKYAFSCKEAIENPEKFTIELADKLEKKN
tara:strand:- start:422 stop:862 length:441 start_codon:yes stop_codon:yes gene_type:complete